MFNLKSNKRINYNDDMFCKRVENGFEIDNTKVCLYIYNDIDIIISIKACIFEIF